MSWVELMGRKWEPTPDEGEIGLHLWRPDAACARQSWYWHTQHIVRRPRGADGRFIGLPAFVSVEISNLHFETMDWRRLEGLEIRSDARWHDAHEQTNEYGRDETSEMTVLGVVPREQPDADGSHVRRLHWLAHDFILRIGARDGRFFPCEVDAWLIPRDDYWREHPESAAEVARFAEGPPNLRMMARVEFEGGTVEVPRIAGDPAEWARRVLREEIACTDFHDGTVEWALRRRRDGNECERMPGWSSSVAFRTAPRPVAA